MIGFERAFVMSLIRSSIKYGYRVVSDEHDGIITVGEIPEDAIEEAKNVADFDNAVLVEKDLAGEEDIQEKLALIAE
jgi:hypothetical protein